MRLPSVEELIKSSKTKELMYPDDLAYYGVDGGVVDMSLGFSGNADRMDAYNVRCVIDLGQEDSVVRNQKEEYSGEKNINLGYRQDNLGGSGGQMVELSRHLRNFPKVATILITYTTIGGTKQIIYSRLDKTLIRISYDSNAPTTTEHWSNLNDSDIFKASQTDSYPSNGTYKLNR